MNKLTIIYDKTESMIVTQKSTLIIIYCKVNTDNHKIEQVKQMRHLGIVFDDKLTRKSHMAYYIIVLNFPKVH